VEVVGYLNVMKNLGIKFSARGFGVRIDIVGSFGFIKSVGSFVLLPHSVHNEHD